MITGARARLTSSPAPAHRIPAEARCVNVSRSASVPKSSAWLFASVTQSTPRAASASAAAGGARKWNRAPGVGAPRSEMQHSRLGTKRSASRAAALGKLPDDRGGNAREGSRHHHRVVRGVPGEPLAPVAHHDLDVLDAAASEIGTRGRGEVLPTLDAPDEGGEPGQERRLEAMARANLEHPLGAVQLERVEHLRHERGLRRDLRVRDRQGYVDVGASSDRGGNEAGTRHVTEGVEHWGVADA